MLSTTGVGRIRSLCLLVGIPKVIEEKEVMNLLLKPQSELSFRELVELVLYLNRPAKIPSCPVCGEALRPTSMGGGRSKTYHCSSEEADFLKDDNGGFGSEAYDHYVRSEHEDNRHADPWAYELAKRVSEAVSVRNYVDKGKNDATG